MPQKQAIRVENQIIEFLLNENQWFCQLKKDYRQIEFSIDTEKWCREVDWLKIQDFATHFKKNERCYIEKCLKPLKNLAETTSFFSEDEFRNAEFVVSGVEILDNQFSLEDKWEFELQFELLDSDPYGLWVVTFQQNCIVGVRREQV